MKTYLDKKGIKFADERLNHAINLVSLAKGGREKMDFLLNHLTEESIEAINAKRYIVCIPIKKNCFMETMLDDVADPSYNTTMQVINILDDNNKFYQFSFNLSYFHNKAIKSNPICTFDTGVVKLNQNGDVVAKVRNEDKTMFFNIVYEKKNSDGMKTLVGGQESKFKSDYSVKYDMEKLFKFIRFGLNSRNYYQRLDKETYRLYYRGKYEYYNTKEQLHLADVIEKVSLTQELLYDIHYNLSDTCENPRLTLNVLLRELEEIDYSKFSKYMSCNDYLKKYNLEKFPYIDYEEWIKDKGSVVCIEETSNVPLFNMNQEKEQVSYSFYNPNKMRYEYEEDENIIKR